MEDHVYFFAGNCQLQYLSAMVGSVSSAQRYFVGHRFNVNVALDGAWADHVERKEFFQQAQNAKREGKHTILLVQETSRSAYSRRMDNRKDFFDEYILIPHVHFSSLWPDRRLKTDLAKLNDRQIKRVFDWERHDVLDKLNRCGVEDAASFAELQWERSRKHLRFYHPGHFSGELFADTLEAMRNVLTGRLPCFEALLSALRRSDGIYQNSTHPISPRIGPILDLAWTRTEFYQAWLALGQTGRDGSLQKAVERAEEVLADPAALGVVAVPFQNHFLCTLSSANIRLGRRQRGLQQLEQATIALKGFGPLVRRTMTAAVKANRLDVVERTLVGVAPYLEVAGNHAGFHTCFETIHSLPEGRATLKRIRERTSERTWVHRYLQNALEE